MRSSSACYNNSNCRGRNHPEPRFMTADSSLPAILGGAPVRPQGPPDWPFSDEAILEALHEAYRDGSWGRYHGGHVARLEQRLAEMHRVDHVLTCGSGTFAVELA